MKSSAKTRWWYYTGIGKENGLTKRPVEKDRERSRKMAENWKNFLQVVPGQVKNYILPIPEPIIYEEGFESDYKAYEDFLELLSGQLGENSEVINISEDLEKYKAEEIYFKCKSSLTCRGGYYAAGSVLKKLDKGSIPDLDMYEEELYHTPDGNSDEADYLYTLPGSKNYCEIFNIQDNGKVISWKSPIIRKGEVEEGTVMGGEFFDWAVVEGDGEPERGVLLLMGDISAKMMVPYLANYYNRIYFVCLEGNGDFGTRYNPVEDIFEEYQISEIVYAQKASDIGVSALSAALGNFRN